MIDHDIELDLTAFPSIVQNTIGDLEKYEEEDNFVMYDGLAEFLEAYCKNLLLDDIITQTQFDMLMRKYGGYV